MLGLGFRIFCLGFRVRVYRPESGPFASPGPRVWESLVLFVRRPCPEGPTYTTIMELGPKKPK